jgi:purine catabolism regulator
MGGKNLHNLENRYRNLLKDRAQMPDNSRGDGEFNMSDQQVFHQPTLRRLLNSEALAEAQIVVGQDLLDRAVVQVVATLTPPMRPGSLVICRPEMVSSVSSDVLDDLSALILIKQTTSEPANLGSAAAGSAVAPAPLASQAFDVAVKKLAAMCKAAEVPLLLVPFFGDPGIVADDIRMAFLRELKATNGRLHSDFLSLVLEDGLDGLVEEISSRLNRPIVIESADFKVLASRNMGATPVAQQRAVSEEAHDCLRQRQSHSNKSTMTQLEPIKAGRRLVLPVLLGDDLAGFVSIMVRPTDDQEIFGDYLQAAALAAMVDFSQRGRDGSVFSVTQKSLLKDLLSGNSLSASDQERLERHYGLDLCDGILVFAMQPPVGSPKIQWPEDQFITTEVEGTRVYLSPFDAKSGLSWQDEANSLIGRIKHATGSGVDPKLQCGAARMAETVLDLPEAYREARQALIIGNMLQEESEFVIGYGDLGVKRLLYLMIDHPEFDRFYEETLAPLEAYDEEWESELVPSLRIYLEQGANLNSAARALFIHRHTLRYRLEQIAEILKVDIDSQEVLLNLQIAFMIKDMKGGVKGKS